MAFPPLSHSASPASPSASAQERTSTPRWLTKPDTHFTHAHTHTYTHTNDGIFLVSFVEFGGQCGFVDSIAA